MHKYDRLEDLAQIKDWLEFGDALNFAMTVPETYDLENGNDVLVKVARLRGSKAHTLQNPIQASQWLKKNYPDVFSVRPAPIGMTLAHYLMKIFSLSPSDGKTIEGRVFSGDIGQVELKGIYDSIRFSRGTTNSSAMAARIRDRRFVMAAEFFFDQHKNELFGYGSEVSNKSIQSRLIDLDLTVTKDGLITTAIELRSYRSRVNKRTQIDLLGRLSLAQKIYEKVLLVVPEEADYNLQEMRMMSDELGLEGIEFASLPEDVGEEIDGLKFY